MNERRCHLNNLLLRLGKMIHKGMKASGLVTAESSLDEQILANGKIKLDRIELISVHIPKSAGTSFRNILYDLYGKGLFRVDVAGGRLAVNEDRNFSAQKLSAMTVAHGHFNMENFREKFEYDPKAPAILWLRDPVERVISNYRYLSSILHDSVDHEKTPSLLKRMKKSLLEFAALPSSQNIMTRFLEGMKLEDFTFVGIVENYKEDIQRLSHLMNWNVETIYRHNITKKKSFRVSEEELQIIKNLNAEDIEIYKHAKTIVPW